MAMQMGHGLDDFKMYLKATISGAYRLIILSLRFIEFLSIWQRRVLAESTISPFQVRFNLLDFIFDCGASAIIRDWDILTFF